MSNKDAGGPAFPFGQADFETGQLCNGWGSEGMTLRQYAAIKLRVPDSGTDWLDEMILTSLKDELAGKAMQSFLSKDKWEQSGPEMFARDAYTMAYEMMGNRQ